MEMMSIGYQKPLAPTPPPTRAWETILSKPARAVPVWAWGVIALLAFYVGSIATTPVASLATVAGIFAVLGCVALLREPIRGLEFCLAVFPFYTFARGALMYLRVPAPLELLGMWTEVVLMLMIANFLIICIKTRTKLRLAWYDGPILIFMASVGYGLVLTISEKAYVAAMYGAHMSLFGMVFYFAARWLPLTTGQMRRLFVIWLSSFALMAAVSLVDYVFRFDFVIECAMQIRPGFWIDFEPHAFFRWYPRMQSLLFAEQVFGSMCACAALFLLCRWPIKPRPFLLAPLLLLMLVCLALSMSRGAFVCFGVGCGVLLLLRGAHRVPTLVCLLLIGATGIGLVGVSGEAAQTLVKRTVSLSNTSDPLAYARVSQWQLALNAFPLYPAGLGVGRAGASSLFHGTGSETGVSVVDGGIFKIMAEQGLPGLILWGVGTVVFYLTFVPIRRELMTRRDGWAREAVPLGTCVLALMAGLQAQNIGGNIFDAYYVQPVFWMLIGLVVRCYENSTIEQARARQNALTIRLETLIGGSARRAIANGSVTGNTRPREQVRP